MTIRQVYNDDNYPRFRSTDDLLDELMDRREPDPITGPDEIESSTPPFNQEWPGMTSPDHPENDELRTLHHQWRLRVRELLNPHQ